jgi:hypothetical protein
MKQKIEKHTYKGQEYDVIVNYFDELSLATVTADFVLDHGVELTRRVSYDEREVLKEEQKGRGDWFLEEYGQRIVAIPVMLPCKVECGDGVYYPKTSHWLLVPVDADKQEVQHTDLSYLLDRYTLCESSDPKWVHDFEMWERFMETWLNYMRVGQ